MLEEYKRDLNSAQGEEDSAEDETEASETAGEESPVNEAVTVELPSAESSTTLPDPATVTQRPKPQSS